MTPGTDEVLSAMSPLVARCSTFEAASRTVEYLCSRGLPHQALSVVADAVRPAAGPSHGRRLLQWDAWRTAHRREQRSRDPARGYYVVSDQRSARRARRLLAPGADAQSGTFGARAVPCVGQLSPKSQHPSSGVVRVRWWSR